jgi:hypothetical protein
MRSPESMSPVVKFHRIVATALPPLRGDKAALGSLPAAAFQYCEPVRAASAYGWYIFPPADIRLLWNGVDVMYAIGDDDFQRLTSIALNSEFVEDWDVNAPEHLKGCWPPFMTAISVPGIVQIWSGFLVSTAENWSVMLGPTSNLWQTRDFVCFEGIIETDTFKPCPLFINIKLMSTNQEILIPRDRPLFQVRPVHRSCYLDAVRVFDESVGMEPRTATTGSMADEDWAGYERTVRKIDTPPSEYEPGRYGAAKRKRAKRVAA